MNRVVRDVQRVFIESVYRTVYGCVHGSREEVNIEGVMDCGSG